MSDETTFLSAIAANPEDTARRLVFADWLEERGDFRAEFIRTGIEFEQTPPYDPRRFRLGERLQELLESPAFQQWLQPDIPMLLDGPIHLKWGWRRGFLTLKAETSWLLTMRQLADDPTDAAEWFASNWIERVEFDGYAGTTEDDWDDSFGLLRNARELHFGTDNYGPRVLERLREWPHLRGLDLSYLGDGGAWDELAALPHLRDLTLRNPDWTMMPELLEARLPYLEVLYIDKEWNDDLPEWNACFPKLRSLSLTHYNAYPDEQLKRFAECPNLRQLELYQRYQPLKREGLNALAKVKRLRSLAFGRCPRGTIEMFAELPDLKRLHIYGVKETIRGLESLTGLRWLSLRMGKLTTALVAQILKLQNLTRLELHFGSMENGAIASLTEAPALQILGAYRQNYKETVDVSELIPLSRLQDLHVGYTALGEKDLHSLQAALPECRIIHKYHDTDNSEYDWG